MQADVCVILMISTPPAVEVLRELLGDGSRLGLNLSYAVQHEPRGLYDNDVVEIARGLDPSARGELEISDVNRAYLTQGRARLVRLGREHTWFDCGTCDSLLAASQHVQAVERDHGERVACLEKIALRRHFIDADACYRFGAGMPASDYGRYLTEIAYAMS